MTLPITYHYCTTCGQQFPSDQIYDVQGSIVCHGCYAAWQQPSQAAASAAAPAPAYSAPAARRAPEYRWLRLGASWCTGVGAAVVILGIVLLLFGVYRAVARQSSFEETIAVFIPAFSLLFAGSLYFVLGEAIIALRDIARNSFRIR